MALIKHFILEIFYLLIQRSKLFIMEGTSFFRSKNNATSIYTFWEVILVVIDDV
jgi:hypothetical protein